MMALILCKALDLDFWAASCACFADSMNPWSPAEPVTGIVLEEPLLRPL